MKVLIFSSVLLLIAVGYAFAQSPFFICPAPEKIKPCECYKGCDQCIATFTCSNLTTQDQLTEVLNRSGDFPFRIAKFQNSVLQYIPHEVFEAKQFRHLVVKDCHLVTLIDSKISGNSTLFEMWMGNVKINRGFQFQSFSSFKVLESLYVENIEVKKIKNDISTHLPSTLKHLQLINTKTSKVADKAFALLLNLVLLVLKNTLIKNVDATMFPPSVTQLILSDNKIKTLPAGFADKLINLERLFLDGNQIEYVEESVFGKIPKLEYLNLEGNPIKCDCKLRWKLKKTDLEIVGDCADPKNKRIADITEKDLEYC